MKTIWKFPLEVTTNQVIVGPGIGAPLDIQWQNGELCLWATVDTDAPATELSIVMIGTGHPRPPSPALYHSTVQCGGFVWHFFNAGIKYKK